MAETGKHANERRKDRQHEPVGKIFQQFRTHTLVRYTVRSRFIGQHWEIKLARMMGKIGGKITPYGMAGKES